MLKKLDLTKLHIVDLEATCWLDKQYQEEQSELLEFGLVEVDLEAQVIKKQFSRLIIPTQTDISAYCTKLTGITQELIKNQGVDLASFAASLRAEFPSSEIVWAGWGHDKAFFDEALRKAKVANPLEHCEYINLQWLYSFLRGKSEILSLHKALEAEGLEFVNGTQHRALPDAYNTARVMLSLLSRIQFFGK